MKSLIKILIKKKIKVSFAESCTGGLLASTVTSINGASKVFNLGLITYSNQSKIKVLKVDVDDCCDVSDYCDIKCMPTFKFYKNNE